MIEIFTKDGIRLDLEKSCSFAIEMENPMLDDSGIPCAFSTEITFLPSTTNRRAFGWLDGMMSAPNNKTIAAEIYVSGIRLFPGTLIYDSIENGKLKYTFSGRDIEDILSMKIYDIPLFGKSVGTDDYFNIMKEASEGKYEGWGVPPVVCRDLLTQKDVVDIDPNVKYRNVFNTYNADEYSDLLSAEKRAMFAPAVRIPYILGSFFSKYKVSYLSCMKDIAILGLYKNNQPEFLSRMGLEDMSVAVHLPDITALDLLKNTLKLVCASLFKDGDCFCIINKGAVLSAGGDTADWSGKISDNFTILKEENMSYIFGYSNDDSESSDVEENARDLRTEIAEMDSFQAIFSYFCNETDYKVAKCTKTGDIYSGKKNFIISGNDIYNATMDLVYHNVGKFDSSNEDDSQYDSTCEFKLVSCLPCKIYSKKTSSNAYKITDAIVPVMKFPGLEEDRSSDVYVGLLYDNQLVDKGVYYDHANTPAEQDFLETRGKMNLEVSALYGEYHKTFAEWLASDRICLKADVNLSIFDIANFRMYNLVLVRGRRFLVKKLSLTFYANSDSIKTEAELLSV